MGTEDNGYYDYDMCYECTGYGDDYYYDSEKDEYVSACDDCPYNYQSYWEDDRDE